MYYFDSFGSKPNKYIYKFIKEYIKYYIKGKNDIKDINIFNVYINRQVHQEENNECGMYAIYFIIKKLKDINKPINNRKIHDKEMSSFRKYIFNL